MNGRIILISLVVLTISVGAKVGAIDLNRPNRKHEHNDKQEKKQKYTCPMHPEVVTDHPGTCPKCGMKLVPLKKDERSTPKNREQAPNSDVSRAGVQRSTSSSD